VAGCAQNPSPAPASEPASAKPQLTGLHFDAQGADFSVWLRSYSDELHRNWTPPEAVHRRQEGTCVFQFTIERDGALSSVRVLRDSCPSSFSHAVQDALRKSHFLPLPGDYRPARLTATMIVRFTQ
jgi:TonB family protein